MDNEGEIAVAQDVECTGANLMRIGINEVLICPRSSGATNREMAILPELLKEIEAGGGESVVYISRDLDEKLSCQLIGDSSNTTVVRTPLPTIPTYQRILKGIPYWTKRVLQDKLDLFHTAYYPVPHLNIPIVLTVHDVRFIHMPETYRRGRYLFLKVVVPLSFSRACRIITVSKDTKNDLYYYFKVPDEKIDIVYNPIATRFKQITNDTILSATRVKYCLPTKYILYIGNLEPRKNLNRLIQAYEILPKEYNYKLVIVGSPEWRYSGLFDRVRRKNLENDILFTGHVEDNEIPFLYNLASIFAFPSLHEGFGIPIIESMACGVPVVTSNISALPEIAGDAAILVNPYDIESIADGIIKVLRDDSLRKKLISKGLNRVKQFNAKDVAVKIFETYKKTLNSYK